MLPDTTSYWRGQVAKHWNYLDKLARERFSNEETASEALLYAMEKIEADDWKRVRQFKGTANFTQYLTVVATRLFEDFARQKFGRLRPPKWIKLLGESYLRVFQLLCQNRLAVDEAIETLCHDPNDRPCAQEVQDAANVILYQLPHCGQYIGEPVGMGPADLEAQASSRSTHQHDNPEEAISDLESADIMQAIGELLFAKEPTVKNKKVTGLIDDFRRLLTLSPQDCVFLKTIYLKACSISAAGRMLGMTASQAHRLHRRLIAKIHKDFKKTGLDEELLLMVRQKECIN